MYASISPFDYTYDAYIDVHQPLPASSDPFFTLYTATRGFPRTPGAPFTEKRFMWENTGLTFAFEKIFDDKDIFYDNIRECVSAMQELYTQGTGAEGGLAEDVKDIYVTRGMRTARTGLGPERSRRLQARDRKFGSACHINDGFITVGFGTLRKTQPNQVQQPVSSTVVGGVQTSTASP